MASIVRNALWLVLACLMAVSSARAQAPGESRVALVIGNNSYKHSPLSNPVADARLMERVLREAGFDVVRAENVGLREMQRLVRDLGTRMRRSGGVGLFYFAGHGVQIRGENYLVSVDSDMRNEDEVADDSISARAVLERMSASGGRVNLLVLDACRNNPFGTRSRSIGGGLASMSAPAGSLVAFSTAPGEVASDGLIGTNGLYTAHLAQSIRQPGLRVEEVLKRTRAAVLRDSGNRQTPWENSALLGDFFFKPPALASRPDDVAATVAPAPTLAGPDPMTIELAFWDSIKTSDHKAEFEEYLKRYPEGTFSGIARTRISTMELSARMSEPVQEPVLLSGGTLPEPPLSRSLGVGDRLQFRDFDPFSGAYVGQFWRMVTRVAADALDFDWGALTIRPSNTTVPRTAGVAELIEDGNARARMLTWQGRFFPADRQYEPVPITFKYESRKAWVLNGEERQGVVASVSGFAARDLMSGITASAKAAIRGTALIDEDTGVVVEFDLRSAHPQYAVRRQWVDLVRAPR